MFDILYTYRYIISFPFSGATRLQITPRFLYVGDGRPLKRDVYPTVENRDVGRVWKSTDEQTDLIRLSR